MTAAGIVSICFLHSPCELLDEEAYQLGNIFLAAHVTEGYEWGNTFQTVVEIATKFACSDHLFQVPVGLRQPAVRSPSSCECSPSARIPALAEHARALVGFQSGCRPLHPEIVCLGRQVPIVPSFWAMAPVNAPFSWPNNSLSSRPVGMAAQLSFDERAVLTGGCGRE